MKNTILKISLTSLTLLLLSSCGLSSLVTVPMRVAGSVVSIVPGVGDNIDNKITKAADIIDIVAE